MKNKGVTRLQQDSGNQDRLGKGRNRNQDRVKSRV
jgi:hypothetical protein